MTPGTEQAGSGRDVSGRPAVSTVPGRGRGHARRRGPDAVTKAYRRLFTAVLTKVDAETAHHLAARAIRVAGDLPPLRAAIAALSGNVSPERSMRVPALSDRPLRGPLGLAAGFDKNAVMVRGLAALGFAFIEVGTVTAVGQPGNPRPRLWRVPERGGLVNRMGFNNDGATAVAGRLRRLRRTAAGRRVVLGVNIGKSKVTPAAAAETDYVHSARTLAPYADYLVVNVSSPNTPGLRDLQQIEALRPILRQVQRAADAAAARAVPVLVKIAPDLADRDIEDIAALSRELDLAGVIAVNTTIRHDHGAGGLSGPPVRDRGLAVVSLLRRHLRPDQLVIGVGGISSPKHARAYLDAGADLLQAYSGFVYGGPTWPARMNRALTARRSPRGALRGRR